MGGFEARMSYSPQSSGLLLTEDNLRMHSAYSLKPCNQTALQPFHKQTRARTCEPYHVYDDHAESDDGDVDATRNIEMRRAASLEALQAYGGCFVSGFLAMQQPLPWTSSTTTASASTSSADSPRPDSDTLSHMDIQELSSSRERSWRSRRRPRNAGRK